MINLENFGGWFQFGSNNGFVEMWCYSGLNQIGIGKLGVVEPVPRIVLVKCFGGKKGSISQYDRGGKLALFPGRKGIETCWTTIRKVNTR